MKMRSGYVSNSSSSSFILKDVKDVPRAIDLYKEFVDGYDIAGWFDGYDTCLSAQEIVESFSSKLVDNPSDTKTELCHYLFELLYLFEYFYAHLLEHRSGESVRLGLRLSDVEEYRDDFLYHLKMCPHPLPVRLFLEAKQRVENGGNISCWRWCTFNDLGDTIDTWLALYPGFTSVAFADDDGVLTHSFIRNTLYRFFDFCVERGLDCFVANNS